MTSDGEILELVGAIYDCILDPGIWPEALEAIAGLVGGLNASVSVQDPMRKEGRFSASWGVPEESIKLYNGRYAALNPVMTSGWYCEIDEPISAAKYVGEEEYFSSRYAKEFLVPLGWGDAIGSHLMKLVNRYGILAIFAPWERGAFEDADLNAIRKISPHVRRAVTIADLLDSRGLRGDMLSETLDLLTVGIILVDENSRIAHANRAARAHFESDSPVVRKGDYLTARELRPANDLRDAIVRSARSPAVSGPGFGIVVPMHVEAMRDVAVWVLPLDGGLRRELAAPFSAKAAVFVKDIGDTTAFPGELFVKRYGITPAECRILMLLVQGLSVAEACEALAIAEPTAKTHLSRLFIKTNTKGQTDLVRLAMSAFAPARQS